MRRIRIAFAAVALALLLGGGLFVHRALSAVEAEREARRTVVAERIYDELERVLSDVLASEEGRPPEDYAFYRTPPGAPPTVRVRSPLARLPEAPFVLGHFQVDDDGHVSTPLEPDDVALARRLGDLPLPLAQRTRAERLLAIAAELGGGAAPRTPETAPPLAQAPGTTRRLDAKGAAAPPGRAEEGKEGERQLYDVLQSLNRGAEVREKRAAKVFEAPRAEEAELAARDEDAPFAGLSSLSMRSRPALRPALPERATLSAPGASEAARREGGALPAPQGELAERAPADAAAPQPATPARAAAPAARSPRPRATAVRVVVAPFAGRRVPTGELVLTRVVRVGSHALRQGVALDPAGLEAHLRDALPPGSVDAFLLGPADAPAARQGYRHRFAEPFDGLAAQLSLAPLEEGPGAFAIPGLAALLALASVLVLASLYRTISVTLEFAERRSNFVAAVSHELKTPLTAIRMYAEMLRDGLVPGEEKRREYYGSITAESERLTRLINNVLEFSRLEQGARTMDLRVGDVGPVLREAVELLHPHAHRHGLRLELSLEEGLPPVRFERDALLQVLFNLVDNACKYAGGATPPVVRLAALRRDGGVELAVRDHGPGVPREELARILEPFHRGGDELVRRTQGAGIGLALVKGLAEQMGGALAVASPPDGGFEARLLLPSRAAGSAA